MNLSPILLWLGVATAVIVLITKVIELRLAALKLKAERPATPAQLITEKAEHPKEKPTEMATLEKRIDRQWFKVQVFATVAAFAGLLGFVYIFHPNTGEAGRNVAFILVPLLAGFYIVIAIIEGRRAIALHEKKGQQLILDAIPVVLTRWANEGFAKVSSPQVPAQSDLSPKAFEILCLLYDDAGKGEITDDVLARRLKLTQPEIDLHISRLYEKSFISYPGDRLDSPPGYQIYPDGTEFVLKHRSTDVPTGRPAAGRPK